MSDCEFQFIWRCLKCSNHFANIKKSEGILNQEKKCPKCKSLNAIKLENNKIYAICKPYDPIANGSREILSEFEKINTELL